MPQLSLYIDDETMGVLRGAADERNVSLSRYARDLIGSKGESLWPAGFWDVYGALQDDSFEAPQELDARLDASVSFDETEAR